LRRRISWLHLAYGRFATASSTLLAHQWLALGDYFRGAAAKFAQLSAMVIISRVCLLYDRKSLLVSRPIAEIAFVAKAIDADILLKMQMLHVQFMPPSLVKR
jgi:hypothetical protein